MKTILDEIIYHNVTSGNNLLDAENKNCNCSSPIITKPHPSKCNCRKCREKDVLIIDQDTELSSILNHVGVASRFKGMEPQQSQKSLLLNEIFMSELDAQKMPEPITEGRGWDTFEDRSNTQRIYLPNSNSWQRARQKGLSNCRG